MDKTITIRIDSQKDDALTLRARESGKTKSDFVRDLIDRVLDPEPLGARIGHLAGSVKLPKPQSVLQRRLRERNWRD